MMTLTQRLTAALQHSRIMQQHRQDSKSRRQRAEEMLEQFQKAQQQQGKLKV